MDIDITKNYYKILNVKENSSESDIKKSYRQLQMKHHPDREATTENNDICCEINNAYEILSDRNKRNQYDMMRKNPFINMCGLGGQGLGASMSSGFGGVSGGRNMNMNNSDNMQNLFTNIFAEALSSELEDLMNQAGNPNGPKIHVFGGNTQDFMNSMNGMNSMNSMNGMSKQYVDVESFGMKKILERTTKKAMDTLYGSEPFKQTKKSHTDTIEGFQGCEYHQA